MTKFEKFMDAYCAFFDYGARGWIIFAVMTLISSVLTLFGFISESHAMVVIFLGMMLMMGFWYSSFAIRKPPQFWVELGKGKNFQH